MKNLEALFIFLASPIILTFYPSITPVNYFV